MVVAVARAVVPLHPQPGTGGGAVGHRGVILVRAGALAAASHEHPGAAGADRHRQGIVAAIGRAVVPLCPQLGAGGGIVGHRGVVLARAGALAAAGHEHPGAAGADRHRPGGAEAVARAEVAPRPQLGAGGGVIGHRGVAEGRVADPLTGAGHEHPGPVRADRHRVGVVVAVARAVVPPRPQPGAGDGAVGHRGGVIVRGGPLAGAGHEHPGAAGADRHREGLIIAVARPAVPRHPQPRTRSSRREGGPGCGQQAGRLGQGPGRELRGRGRACGTGNSDAANGGKARHGGA